MQPSDAFGLPLEELVTEFDEGHWRKDVQFRLTPAWQVLKPGGRSPFQVRNLAVDSNRRLFAMGLLTNLLNPKAAMLYLSLLPQFIDPARGSVLMQSLVSIARRQPTSVKIS